MAFARGMTDPLVLVVQTVNLIMFSLKCLGSWLAIRWHDFLPPPLLFLLAPLSSGGSCLSRPTSWSFPGRLELLNVCSESKDLLLLRSRCQPLGV